MAVTTEIEAGVVLADRFRVHRRLGAGGMATVFLAEDCVLGREVAIKRLHTEGSEDDVRRFRREARLGASLSHPNLATVFDTQTGPDGVLIVMEYVRGRPLSDLIGPVGMSPKRLLQIIRPVGSALDYAHERGVVHRDVKPANILIAEDGRVKLVDLGTATARHITQITGEHEVAGTLDYIAPERLSADSPGEPAADVYSLAVVAFEALAGCRPRQAKTPRELLDRILDEPPPDIRGEWPQAPSELARALELGLNPSPSRRQRSPCELVRELDAALAEGRRADAEESTVHQAVLPDTDSQEKAAPAPWRPPPPLSREGEPKRRGGWLLPALACIAVLLAGGTWLALAGDDDGGGGKQTASKKPAAKKQEKATESPAAGTAAAAAPAASAPVSEPVTDASGPALGAALNDQGYSLIQQGSYDEAIPVLQRAVAAFPEGTSDINYAYALYTLGHALRMAGRPDEAIPILEQRLEIPNQTGTVQAELDAARADAGQ